MTNRFLVVLLVLAFFACKKTTEKPPVVEQRPPGNDVSEAMFIKQAISTMGPRVVSIFFNLVKPDESALIDNLDVNNLDVWETNQTGTKKKLDWIANAFHLKDKDQLNYESRIVLILDVSAETDVAKIKESANNVIDALTTGQQLSVITFATTVAVIHEFSDDKTSLKTAVDQIVNGGVDAKLYDAVKEGLNSWDDIYSYDKILQGNLIVVTDSDNSGGSTSLIDLLFIREAGDQPKRIYAYGIGGSVNKDALEELANARHYFLNDISELPAQITQVQQNLAAYENGFYMFDFMSAQTAGTVEVMLELIGNQYSDDGSTLKGVFTTTNFYPGAVQPGITINANKSIPAGVTAMKIGKIAGRKIVAFNNLGAKLSDFVWSTTTDAIIKVEEDPKDNRQAIITAVGEVGDVGKLVVDDPANTSKKELDVEIVDAGVGHALFEFFENLPGRGLFLLMSSGKYPDNPDVRTLVTELNITDWSTVDYDDFGCRFRAYLIPPETGLFQLSISLNTDDEQGELYLSDTPFPDENLQMIAYRNNDGSDVTSEYIMLEKDKIYYLDFLYKEDRYGHTCSIRWKRDNDAGDDSIIGTRTVVISGAYMAPYVVDFDMTE
jgi:hypothetical protein